MSNGLANDSDQNYAIDMIATKDSEQNTLGHVSINNELNEKQSAQQTPSPIYPRDDAEPKQGETAGVRGKRNVKTNSPKRPDIPFVDNQPQPPIDLGPSSDPRGSVPFVAQGNAPAGPHPVIGDNMLPTSRTPPPQPVSDNV
ncbi:hypothetical protein RhiLY_02690 [Ceratobasidium sp. AG-Ba]|nr:hypothetical protein RhiLY_02690 [Ceratobasidium sp. AG-Ba]